MKQRPKGPDAAHWRKRKFDALRRYTIPADLMTGSLVLGYRRCGKTGCHCAQGKGHPSWTLTFRSDNKTRVEHIPVELLAEVRRRVEAGHDFQDALREVMSANVELFALARRQKREHQHKKKRKHP
jgi:hypothetical protein